MNYRILQMGLGVALMALVVGCGDDETSGTTSSSSSSSTTGSGGTGGSGGSGGSINPSGGGGGGGQGGSGSGGSGGAGGGGVAQLEGTAKVVALSASGADAFYGVAYAADGSFFAAGFSAQSHEATADRSMVLAKFTAAGDLDTSFGTAGIAKKNLAVDGGAGEVARAVVVQSTGKIVIGGTIEHDVTATGTAAEDRDIALVRFNADGTLDDTFGTAGVQILDLSTAVEIAGSGGTPALSGADSMWSLSVTADDKILVHGTKRAEGLVQGSSDPRPDSDWAVARVNANGGLDTTFGTAGVFSFDIDKVAGQARTGTLLADGSFIGAGYANTPSLGSQQPVVYKVNTAGKLDTTFGAAGVFHDTVLPALAEAYAAKPQGDKLVTAGYGRATSTDVVGWLSIRLTATGELDPTYGTNGVVQLTLEERSNARGLVILPDERPLLFGGGSRVADKTEATIAVLEKDGTFDATYGTGGVKAYDLGGTADVFWAGAVSPDQSKVAIVGIKGVAAADATAASNDDASVLVLSITK